MSKLQNFFSDDYDRETLLIPSIAVILTAIVVGTILGLNVSLLFGFVVMGVELASVVMWLLASSVREKGKMLEANLFPDGMPTTDALRLRHSSGFETVTRRDLLQKVTGITLLTKRQELANPEEADDRIKYAVDSARERMRDPKKFMLLRRELKSYGQWRNLVAIRQLGLGISLLSVTVAALVIYLSQPADRGLPSLALMIAVLGSLYWIFVTSPGRVSVAAHRYKEQFFKSLTLLDAKKNP